MLSHATIHGFRRKEDVVDSILLLDISDFIEPVRVYLVEAMETDYLEYYAFIKSLADHTSDLREYDGNEKIDSLYMWQWQYLRTSFQSSFY